MSEAPAAVLTTDGWTSRATRKLPNSHMTSPPNGRWRATFFRHAPLRASPARIWPKRWQQWWKLERAQVSIPVTTDKARNLFHAVGAAGRGPRTRCSAPVINADFQKALAGQRLSGLPAKIREIVTFFHRSTAALVLEIKQEFLLLPVHKWIHHCLKSKITFWCEF